MPLRFSGERHFRRPAALPPPGCIELHKADGLLNSNIAVAEFLPNTRLAWHNHPGGQILLITDGVGYYQEKANPGRSFVRAMWSNAFRQCEHWHGASVESGMTYVAVSPAQKGGTVWAQAVTDEEYKSPAVG